MENENLGKGALSRLGSLASSRWVIFLLAMHHTLSDSENQCCDSARNVPDLSVFLCRSGGCLVLLHEVNFLYFLHAVCEQLCCGLRYLQTAVLHLLELNNRSF